MGYERDDTGEKLPLTFGMIQVPDLRVDVHLRWLDLREVQVEQVLKERLLEREGAAGWAERLRELIAPEPLHNSLHNLVWRFVLQLEIWVRLEASISLRKKENGGVVCSVNSKAKRVA